MLEAPAAPWGGPHLMMNHESTGSIRRDNVCGEAKGDDIALATTFIDVAGNHVRLLASGTRSARQWILDNDQRQSDQKSGAEMLFLLKDIEVDF